VRPRRSRRQHLRLRLGDHRAASVAALGPQVHDPAPSAPIVSWSSTTSMLASSSRAASSRAWTSRQESRW